MGDAPIDDQSDDRPYCYRATLPSDKEAREILGMQPLPPAGTGTLHTPTRPGDVFTESDVSGGGERVFLCGSLGPPCLMCGDVADALCDFPIGHENRTCDRPICSRCSPEVGVDRNYCIPHATNGPGMLLFVSLPDAPPPRIEFKPRLPRAPKSLLRRHRAVSPEMFSGRLFWRVRSAWTDEFTARRMARDSSGQVQTWDAFAAWHRATWPLKKRAKSRDD